MSERGKIQAQIALGLFLFLTGLVTFLLRSVLFAGILSLIAMGAGLLILLRLLLKKKASPKVYKTVKWIFLPLFFLLLASFLTVEGFVISAGVGANRREAAAENDFSYVVVPGAGLYKMTGRPSLLYALRLRRAAELYEKDPELTLVICGGQGDDEVMPEAEAGRDYLLGLGIPAEAVACETESLDTAENFRNFAALFPDAKKVAIVTNDFHVFRCSLLAKRYGLEPVAFASPTPQLLLSMNYYAREFISLAIYLVESNGYIIDTSNFHL
ncbi:MAG: YdcF family protein [Clostridia bacterium]|nr:YdcF family protein [Clostridia bacterium]